MLSKFKISSLFLCLHYASVISGQAHLCDGTFFFSALSNNASSLYRFNPMTLDFDLVNPQLPVCNGMGFNPADNYVYAMFDGNKLMRIDVNGQFISLGQIGGLDASWLWAGDFSPQGEYVVTGTDSRVFRITVNGPNPVVIGSKEKYYINGTGSGTPVFGDIAFDASSGQCYGFDMNERKMATIDPFTGAVNAYGVVQENIAIGVGAIVSDVQGNLYGFVADEIYQIDKNTGVLNFLILGPSNEGGVDACACPYYLELFKTVSKEDACAGDTLVYSFHLVNSSRNELKDIRFVDSLPAPLQFLSDPSDLMGGSLSNNTGQGFSDVEITGMTIPMGTTSFQISATAPAGLNLPIFVGNQAQMDGFPAGLANEVLSDDLSTLWLDDPTWVRVSPAIDYEVSFSHTGPLCLGETLQLAATAPEPGTYQWSGPLGFSGEYASVTVPNIQLNQAGVYHLHFTNYLGCSVDTFMDIAVNPLPAIDWERDTSLCLATPKILYPGEFASYLWQDGSIGDYLSVKEYGVYWVQVTNEFGCTLEDSTTISDGCPAQVYVPNIFSPNDDNINDLFYAYTIAQVGQFHIKVFDRWGELVFKSDHINHGWDGTFRGRPMPSGVYAYHLETTFINGQSVSASGDVTLIR